MVKGWGGKLRAGWAGALLLSFAAGCGGPLPALRTVQPLIAGFDGLDALAATNVVQAAFNDTYQERIDLNESRSRRNVYNTDKGLLRLIRTARRSLEGAFYDIEELGIADELIQAHQRGVAVRLVTDSDNLADKKNPNRPREAIARLHKAGVPVVPDNRAGIMHHKFLVADRASVWTGSTNLTPTSLYLHNNNALTLRFPPLAMAFVDEFNRLFQDQAFGAANRPNPTAPFVSPVADGHVTTYFSPFGGARDAVINELQKARKSIRFMTFSLTEPEAGKTIMAKAKDGVKVEGVFDRWLAGGQYSLWPVFKKAGLDVWCDGNEALMHHKVIIIDDKVVITGSYNFSQSAEITNNEAMLIVRGMPKIALAYKQEFARLLHAAKNNHPPATKPNDPEHRTGLGP